MPLLVEHQYIQYQEYTLPSLPAILINKLSGPIHTFPLAIAYLIILYIVTQVYWLAIVVI